MGQKYQVTGKFPIATLTKGDMWPADPLDGRPEGDTFDADDLDPRTRVDLLIKARLIAPVADPAPKQTLEK